MIGLLTVCKPSRAITPKRASLLENVAHGPVDLELSAYAAEAAFPMYKLCAKARVLGAVVKAAPWQHNPTADCGGRTPESTTLNSDGQWESRRDIRRYL